MNELPPSFPPTDPQPRPSAAGAKEVGRRKRMSDEPTLVNPVGTKPSVRADPPRRKSVIVDQPRRENQPQATTVAPPSYAPSSARTGTAPDPGRTRPEPRPEPRPSQQAQPRPVRRRRIKPYIITALVVLLVAVIAWPIYLYNYGQSRFEHVDALSGAPDTPGRTVLFAGTDKRSDGGVADGVEGQRSDSIMLVHQPESGTPSLISLPRDTYVEIPGYGHAKLNTSYSVGGPKLLVQTVEQLTGLTIDHYVEVGMDGISSLVDAVGGVELCLDYDVNDELSGLNWTAGCHESDGPTALAFSRMRYSDPLGDIGRTARQRQVISKIFDKITDPGVLLNPFAQRDVVGAAAEVLTVDEDSSPMDLGQIALGLRSAMGPDGVIGTPPIADLNYHPGRIGSTVLLDEARIGPFWEKVADGSITPDDLTGPGL